MVRGGVAGVVVLTALLCVACAATLDTSSTPIWSGMHGNSQRRNVLPWAGPSTALTLVSNITWTGPGKTHGAPAVDAKGRAYAVYWNQTNQGFPFLRRWDNPGGGSHALCGHRPAQHGCVRCVDMYSFSKGTVLLCLGGCVYVCMCVCVYVCMFVCVYVCMCVYVCVSVYVSVSV
jgi:hypothetical protein